MGGRGAARNNLERSPLAPGAELDFHPCPFLKGIGKDSNYWHTTRESSLIIVLPELSASEGVLLMGGGLGEAVDARPLMITAPCHNYNQ